MNLQSLRALISDGFLFDYLTSKMILNPPREGSECKKCQSGSLNREPYHSFPGFAFRCGRRQCRNLVVVSSTSWLLYNTRLEWGNVLLLLYCWSTEFTPSQAERELTLNKNTVTEFYSKFRQATYFYCISNSQSIGGIGHVVEIDNIVQLLAIEDTRSK